MSISSVYKIINDVDDKVYVGSTCKEYLSQRLAAHKSDFRHWQRGKIGRVTSFDLIELDDVEIILLESYPCNSKDELTARERHWCDLNKELIVNKNRPSISCDESLQSKREDYIKNKEYYLELQKQYRENHKDELIQYRKIKYNCECGSLNIAKSDKSKHNKTDKHQTYLMIQTL
jgi:hypothetical protein